MKTCPNCRGENRDEAKFCSTCRTALAPTAADQPPVVDRPTGNAALQPTKPLRRSSTPGAPATLAISPVGAKTGTITQPLPPDAQPQPGQPGGSAAIKTAPLTGACTGFAPLPDGALLHGDRYEILETRQEARQVNVYQVYDTQPVRRCPNSDCGFLYTAPGETHCQKCGIELNQVQAVRLTYLLREAADPDKFNVEGQLIAQQLNHLNLLLPQAHFVETPYADSRRAYLVVPEFSSPLASSFTPPQELPRVLDWGLQLANALAGLHERQITLRPTDLNRDLNRIAIEDDGRVARWTNLSGVDIIFPAAQAAAPQRFAQDIHMLAQILFYLLTGLDEYASTGALPETVQDFFARALTSQQQPFQSAQEFSLALKELAAQTCRPASIDLLVGRCSDVGQERQLNEDGLLTLVMNQMQESTSQPLGLFVVADGMGGHSAGEIATRLTLDAVRQKAVAELLTPTPQPPAYDQWLNDATAAANTSVFEHRRQAGTDMGNTLVMAIVSGDSAFISNVGDSRAYLINQQKIEQITTDHSLVERLVATGKITPQEARTHPQRNVIYRTIGDKARVEADVFTQLLEVGDYLLLCSDGLSGMITDQDIFNNVNSSVSPQEACKRLVEAANAAGGEDNITVVIIQAVAG